MKRAIWPALLAISLTFNLLLLWRDHDRADAAKPAPAAAAAPTRESDPHTVLAAPAPVRDVAAAPAITPPPANAPMPDEQGPLADFEHATGGPEAEPRVKAFVDAIFQDAPAGYSYDLECRGNRCKVEVVEPDDASKPFDWGAKMQSGNNHGMFSGYGFQSGSPGEDPVTHEAIFTEYAFLELAAKQPHGDGAVILADLVKRIDAAPELAACKRQHAGGFLSIELQIGGAPPHIEETMGGNLALDPAGACAKDVIDAQIGATDLPESVSPGVNYFRINF